MPTSEPIERQPTNRRTTTYERPPATFGVDQALGLQQRDGLAHGLASCAVVGHELVFRWQLVTHAQRTRLDVMAQTVRDLPIHRQPAQRVEPMRQPRSPTIMYAELANQLGPQ